MGPDHRHFQITAGPSICKQVLCIPESELVNKNAFQIAFLFFSGSWVVCDSANFPEKKRAPKRPFPIFSIYFFRSFMAFS